MRKESRWDNLFKPERNQSAGEDIADTIALIVICVLLMMVLFQ